MPFKSGCKDGFTSYLHSMFTAHTNLCRSNNIRDADAVGSFRPALTVGKLKPFLPAFVEAGIAKLKTQQMMDTIKHAFAEHGRFTVMWEMAERLCIGSIDVPTPSYVEEVEDAQIDRISLLDMDDSDADVESGSDCSILPMNGKGKQSS